MPTPYPTWKPGRLARTDANLIQIPEWIKTMIDQTARPFSETCFREGFFCGWNVASAQYLRGPRDAVYVFEYILAQKGATPAEVTEVLKAVVASLPDRMKPETWPPAK